MANARQLVVLTVTLACCGCGRGDAEPTPTVGATPIVEGPRVRHDGGQPAVEPFKPPLLWEVEHPGGPSYVLGTMHLGVDADRDIHPIVWKKIADSDVVVLETLSSDFGAEQLRRLESASAEVSLQSTLTPPQWKTLVEVVSAQTPDSLNATAPLILSTRIASQWLPVTEPLDMVIERRSKAAGKELVALESVEETLRLVHDPAHTAYLGFMLDDLDRAKHELESVLRAYKNGDAKDLEGIIFNRDNIANHGALLEILFYQRNQQWLPRIEKSLRRGKTTIAVGVGHLLGPRGVIALLNGAGFRTVRIGAVDSVE